MNRFEKIGLGLSVICAIHCVLTPLFIALLPFVSSKIVENPVFEMILLGSSFLIVGVTNIIGFIKHHKKYAPLAITLLSFSLILTGHLIGIDWLETVFSVIGGALIAYSIVLNSKAKQATCDAPCCNH